MNASKTVHCRFHCAGNSNTKTDVRAAARVGAKVLWRGTRARTQ